MSFEYIVVGAGYFGCSIGYHLAKTGAKTLLIDAGEVASGASGANFGCVQVQDANMGTSLHMTLEGYQLMRNVSKELGCNIGYSDAPSLVVAENEVQMEALVNRYEEKKSVGLDIRLLTAKQVEELEPNIRKGSVLGATWYMQGRIWPFSYMLALVKRGREAGLEVRENTPVESLYMEGGVCRGVVLRNGEVLRAQQVILATGGGTKRLGATADLHIPVESVKAECFVSEPVAPFLRTYYSSAGFFEEAHSPDTAAATLCIAQSEHGNLLIAETTKPNHIYDERYKDNISPEHCFKISKLATYYFPALENVCILRSWVTQSPYTSTHEPVFGYSGVDGLFIAAGFKSSAVLSKLVGELTVEYFTKGRCRYDLSTFESQITPL